MNESQQWKAQAIQFNVKYAEGTLSAKAYDESGNEIKDTLGSASVTTNSDKGSSLAVTAEKTEIQADGSSLSYIDIDVNDKDGRFVSAADNSIRFTLTGNGTIVGVDNGNPSTVDKFQQKSVLTSDKTAKIKAYIHLYIFFINHLSRGFTNLFFYFHLRYASGEILSPPNHDLYDRSMKYRLPSGPSALL